VEPVVADAGLPYALAAADLPKIFEEYDRLTDRLLEERQKGGTLNFFHFMLDLSGGPCAVRRLRGCSCGNEYIAVTPEGDIYPCHQFVGQPQWRMGNVHNDRFDLQKKDYFAHINIYTKPECRKCWAKFFCSGGCNANNSTYTGNVQTPHPITCEIEKKRLECALYMKSKTK
jgi:uncharacterized protein